MSGMLVAIGYILAVLVGFTLGLLGGGGSILSVPILVYCFEINPIEATTYSLFIVGSASVAATLKYFEEKMISLPAVILFGVPSVATMFLTRRFIIHELPENLFYIGDYAVNKNLFVLLLFAFIMIIAARFMVKGKDRSNDEEVRWQNALILPSIIIGIATGFLTSLIGAGGGFIIIPVLIKFFKMPMKRAVGTSLCIIMLNSLIGFIGDVSAHADINWLFLMKFTGLTVIGIFAGIYTSRYISGSKLKPAFGYFVLVMGVFIIVKELILNQYF